MSEFRADLKPLVLRSNRFLASVLAKRKLIHEDDLNEANEKLLDAIASGNPRQMSILSILIYELKKLTEESYIEFLVEHQKLGLIHLENYSIRKTENEMNDPALCWATWTIPFDRVGDYYLVASAYQPSNPVVEHWEKIADHPIVWYGTTIQSIANAIEKLTIDTSEENS
jgi:hypothetical protein